MEYAPVMVMTLVLLCICYIIVRTNEIPVHIYFFPTMTIYVFTNPSIAQCLDSALSVSGQRPAAVWAELQSWEHAHWRCAAKLCDKLLRDSERDRTPAGEHAVISTLSIC